MHRLKTKWPTKATGVETQDPATKGPPKPPQYQDPPRTVLKGGSPDQQVVPAHSQPLPAPAIHLGIEGSCLLQLGPAQGLAEWIREEASVLMHHLPGLLK